MAEDAKSKEVEAKTFTQDQLNDIVAAERKRTQEKFADYDTMKQQLTEFSKHKEELSQKELEGKKEYEKLKEGWGMKEKDYGRIIGEKDFAIKNMKIDYELTQEIIRNNAHGDASKLIRDLATVDQNGNVVIKGKNASGIDSDLSVSEGVKAFLKERPYLVKATGQGGAGSSAAGQGDGRQSGVTSPSLSDELAKARMSGDRKRVDEIKLKIRSNLQMQGVAVL